MNWLNFISIQALLTIIWLLSIPKEAGNAIVFGFSLKRLALLIPLFIPLIGSIFLKLRLKNNPFVQGWLQDASKKSRLAVILTVTGFLFAVLMLSAGFLYHFLAIPIDINIYIRLLPIFTCYFILGIEAVLFVPLILYPSKQAHHEVNRTFPWLPFCISFGVLITGLLIVTLTGLGINPERVSIISLGSPLLEGQIWYISLFIALMMMTVYAWKCIPDGSRPSFPGKLDLIIALILWLLAVVLWMSLPLPKNNYFAPQVQAPNFEKYPFSDAEQYDFNSLYVLYGTLRDFVISKPLYVSLLALFHAIAGLSYIRIIFLQTLLVAVFPSVLYLIGKELHSRIGGITIALFAIMREITAIRATSIANISSTKLLLSDMPATLLASILVLMLIRWFKSSEKKISGYEFIIGGLVGMFILTRIQTLALVFFILMMVIIRYFRNFKSIASSALLFLFAVGLVVTPILIRNHAITGVYWIDDPRASTGLSRIMTEGLNIEEEGFSDSSSNQTLQNNGNLFEFLLKNNLGDLIYFTGDNFLRNEISSILTLPVRLGNKISFNEFFSINLPFWMEVYSQHNALNLIVFFINFALIALGFTMVFQKYPMVFLAVLGFHIVYNLSSSVVRLSGWRFVLPADWFFYFLYALGLVECLIWCFKKIAGWNLSSQLVWFGNNPIEIKTKRKNLITFLVYGLLFIFMGAAIPLRENLLPSLIPEYSRTNACLKIENQLLESENKQKAAGFYDFCTSDKAQVLFGYGVYPRFFDAGEGFYDRSTDPWFGRQPYSRLVFRLIGTQNGKIFIKSKIDGIQFPNGALVYTVGTLDPKSGALVVFIEGDEPELIFSSDLLSDKSSFHSLITRFD